MDEKITISNMVSRIKGSVSLELAKKLMDRVEAYARSKGMACVIAVDDAHGNPVAVHVMENAFLVSYQVATQKAYTAVAVKMSTMELSRMVQPGGTFYGLEAMHDGKIVAFGGGVPLKIEGTIVGGLGISGGTGEEDNDVAVYGLKVFAELTGQS
ncbi:MAG: heme-binding protein [Lachnospiraceae bacterium]|jgi:cob(I)alamin adenosyltransferase|nr:heme-binding protein [Eubacterium sp.]MCI6794952.1 heme-binding protein [Lachnospiraceae bacterium]MDD7047998.1 heme-binding protein [Lachnospiraceae bacterium]